MPDHLVKDLIVSDKMSGRELVANRFRTAEEVAAWIQAVHDRIGQTGPIGQTGQAQQSNPSKASRPSSYSELAANAALVLINVACSLLDRQIAAQAEAF